MSQIQQIITNHRRWQPEQFNPYAVSKIEPYAPSPMDALKYMVGEDDQKLRKLRTIMRNLGRERNCAVLYAAPYEQEFRRVIRLQKDVYQLQAWNTSTFSWDARDSGEQSTPTEMVDSLFARDNAHHRSAFLRRWSVMLEFRSCLENQEMLEDFVRFMPDEDTLLALYFDSRRYNLGNSLFLQPVRAVCAWIEGCSESSRFESEPLTYKAIELFQEKFGFVRDFESVPKDNYQFELAMNYENLAHSA